MEENNPAPSLMSHAMRSGLIIGAIGIIITLLIYLVNPELMVSMWMFLVLILNLVLVVVFGIQYRNQSGGFLSFGSAWKHGFLTLLIAGILGTIFNILMHTVIDPGLKDFLIEASVENAEDMARSFGADESAIEQAAESTRESTAAGFTIGGMFKNLGIAIIIYAVIALITGLIVRKNPPEEVI